MNEPPQTRKRIVSKGEYAKTQGKRWGQGATGAALIIGSVVIAGTILGMSEVAQLFFATAFAGSALVLGTGIGGIILKQAITTNPGVPLTRANTADLPAPESLVRASEEPVQQPQAVLLRAVAETAERHEEQLVRAARGRKE